MDVLASWRLFPGWASLLRSFPWTGQLTKHFFSFQATVPVTPTKPAVNISSQARPSRSNISFLKARVKIVHSWEDLNRWPRNWVRNRQRTRNRNRNRRKIAAAARTRVRFKYFLECSIPSLFFVSFWSFSIFSTNQCEKRPSSTQCWDLNPWPLEFESPLITTRPGLLPWA